MTNHVRFTFSHFFKLSLSISLSLEFHRLHRFNGTFTYFHDISGTIFQPVFRKFTEITQPVTVISGCFNMSTWLWWAIREILWSRTIWTTPWPAPYSLHWTAAKFIFCVRSTLLVHNRKAPSTPWTKDTRSESTIGTWLRSNCLNMGPELYLTASWGIS